MYNINIYAIISITLFKHDILPTNVNICGTNLTMMFPLMLSIIFEYYRSHKIEAKIECPVLLFQEDTSFFVK